ncbi:MAG: hypothetical protein N3E51_05140, partial [Candidatus Micrarchaeota archaeon]|nr:hypothetical protein [Candidatus Micrarchaeota archaeon]
MIETKVDQLISIVEKKKSIGIDMLAKQLSLTPQTAELICTVLERGGLIDINYPLNIAEKPSISFRMLPAEPKKEEEGGEKGKVIANYSFTADGVPASVSITDTEKEKRYTISLVEFGTATKIFLDLI